MGEKKTRIWWMILCSIATLNLSLLGWTIAVVKVDSSDLFWQLRLCGVFVVVCAFRSFVPRVDLERSCLFDSPLSSMVVGRSAATIAELCFAIQCALFLNEVGRASGISFVETLSWLVVPPLFIAQLFCWHSVCTRNHWGHAIENSLWTGTFAFLGLCLGISYLYLSGPLAVYAGIGFFLAVLYVAFMVTVDVPMYIERWREDRQTREAMLSLGAGFSDALKRRHASWDWTIWKPEVAWMTGYFSGAVWVSLALVHLPRH